MESCLELTWAGISCSFELEFQTFSPVGGSEQWGDLCVGHTWVIRWVILPDTFVGAVDGYCLTIFCRYTIYKYHSFYCDMNHWFLPFHYSRWTRGGGGPALWREEEFGDSMPHWYILGCFIHFTPHLIHSSGGEAFLHCSVSFDGWEPFSAVEKLEGLSTFQYSSPADLFSPQT